MNKQDRYIYIFRIVYLAFWFFILKDLIIDMNVIQKDNTSILVAMIIYISIMYLVEKILRKYL